MRRRGLLRALAEGPPPPRIQPPPVPPPPPEPPPAAQLPPAAQPPPDLPHTTQPPPPLEPPAPPVAPALLARLSECKVACGAVVVGLADLPSVEVAGEMIEVALLRLQVRRPEGEMECCVRQHIPYEIRGLLGPGSGVMALAHESDPRVAIVDWGATGAWIGAELTFPEAPQQYDWPERAEWPVRGEIEIRDVNGHDDELAQRRSEWRFTSADLVALAPLPSRVDAREEWRITLELRDGKTIAIKERMPLLVLARLRHRDEDRVATPIDVLVSSEGELAIDWEATLRQPELRSRGS